MSENNKNRGFMDVLKDGVDYTIKKILTDVSSPLTAGAEKAVQNIEARVTQLEERMLHKAFSFVVISFGTLFLVLALFFSLKEFLGWSNSVACFAIGVLLLVIGLLLNVRNRGGKNGK